jgi:hypothetical protein
MNRNTKKSLRRLDTPNTAYLPARSVGGGLESNTGAPKWSAAEGKGCPPARGVESEFHNLDPARGGRNELRVLLPGHRPERDRIAREGPDQATRDRLSDRGPSAHRHHNSPRYDALRANAERNRRSLSSISVRTSSRVSSAGVGCEMGIGASGAPNSSCGRGSKLGRPRITPITKGSAGPQVTLFSARNGRVYAPETNPSRAARHARRRWLLVLRMSGSLLRRRLRTPSARASKMSMQLHQRRVSRVRDTPVYEFGNP